MLKFIVGILFGFMATSAWHLRYDLMASLFKDASVKPNHVIKEDVLNWLKSEALKVNGSCRARQLVYSHYDMLGNVEVNWRAGRLSELDVKRWEISEMENLLTAGYISSEFNQTVCDSYRDRFFNGEDVIIPDYCE